MATWIAHLRIAENILNNGYDFARSEFIAGNIAPDAGVPNSDSSKFDPDPKITHWKDKEKNIRYDKFFEKYIDYKSVVIDSDAYSFFVGYYVHLLTDFEWAKFFKIKYQELKENFSKDPNFIWRVKEDWYGQDFEYLKLNKDCIFFTCFQHLTQVKDYLDYFPKGAFDQRFRHIREMYLKYYKDHQGDYIYLSKNDMDDFVESATKNIMINLDDKLIKEYI